MDAPAKLAPVPKLYGELANWWPLLSAPGEYAEEAAVYRQHLTAAAQRPLKRVLELGSGGGNNASYFKAHFDMTLVDISAEMLDVSRSLNPECEHIQGDMRTIRLGKRFDAVFVHDAICYMTTEADLAAAIATASAHCATGGSVLLAPDHLKETFAEATGHGGHDGHDRALRYLEWTHDPDPNDEKYLVDFAYLLRAGDDIRVAHDRHVNGLFARSVWLRLLADAGLEAHGEEVHLSDATVEVFVAVKRSGP